MIQKNEIEIKRNVIERSLMVIKDVIKKYRKEFFISIISIFFIIVIIITGIVYYQSVVETELTEFETILSKYKKNEDLNNPNKKERIKNLQKTVDDLNKVIDSTYWGYVNENGYYIIADLYFSLDMNQEGKDYLLKYVDNSPSPFFASLALLRAGIACEKIGENEEAFKIYKQLEEDYIDTKIADEIYYNLGRIYNKKGNLNKAREYYNKVILMYPMSIHADMAKKRLLVLGYSNNPKIKKSEM